MGFRSCAAIRRLVDHDESALEKLVGSHVGHGYLGRFAHVFSGELGFSWPLCSFSNRACLLLGSVADKSLPPQADSLLGVVCVQLWWIWHASWLHPSQHLTWTPCQCPLHRQMCSAISIPRACSYEMLSTGRCRSIKTARRRPSRASEAINWLVDHLCLFYIIESLELPAWCCMCLSALIYTFIGTTLTQL